MSGGVCGEPACRCVVVRNSAPVSRILDWTSTHLIGPGDDGVGRRKARAPSEPRESRARSDAAAIAGVDAATAAAARLGGLGPFAAVMSDACCCSRGDRDAWPGGRRTPAGACAWISDAAGSAVARKGMGGVVISHLEGRRVLGLTLRSSRSLADGRPPPDLNKKNNGLTPHGVTTSPATRSMPAQHADSHTTRAQALRKREPGAQAPGRERRARERRRHPH